MTKHVADHGLGDDDPGPKSGGLTAPGLILVRATVNLPGLRAGETALVDPTLPYMQDCLRGQYIVPLPAHLQPGEHPRGGLE